MLKKAMFPGKYIQGAGALDELPSLIKLLGRQGLILASPMAYKKLLPESSLTFGVLAGLQLIDAPPKESAVVFPSAKKWTCPPLLRTSVFKITIAIN